MEVWFEDYAKIKVRPSSHQIYRGYIDNHIKPNIGSIPLEKLIFLDLQKLYKKLLTKGRVDRLESKSQSKGLSANPFYGKPKRVAYLSSTTWSWSLS